MKTTRTFAWLTILGLAWFGPAAHADYSFWLYPENNSVSEIVSLEKQYRYRAPIVGFIFDAFGKSDSQTLSYAVKTLGTDRVYHVTLSPFGLSAKEVASGKFDAEYSRLFETMKASEGKFVFRTMHEMNGNWFSWSGDPKSYRLAYQRIWNLSRKAWLDRKNILFDFSVNVEDLPSEDGAVGGKIVYCSAAAKKKTGCTTFEDFYPGDAYVDVVGLSLYNWGRGRNAPWATWKSFSEMLLKSKMQAYQRLTNYNKPVFIDEVGTTAVDFSGDWSSEKVLAEYRSNDGRKNLWLTQMRETLAKDTNVVGVLYFNRDRTKGLSDRSRDEELDWAVLSPKTHKEYPAVLDFFTDTHMKQDAVRFQRESIRRKRPLQRPIPSK